MLPHCSALTFRNNKVVTYKCDFQLKGRKKSVCSEMLLTAIGDSDLYRKHTFNYSFWTQDNTQYLNKIKLSIKMVFIVFSSPSSKNMKQISLVDCQFLLILNHSNILCRGRIAPFSLLCLIVREKLRTNRILHKDRKTDENVEHHYFHQQKKW